MSSYSVSNSGNQFQTLSVQASTAAYATPHTIINNATFNRVGQYKLKGYISMNTDAVNRSFTAGILRVSITTNAVTVIIYEGRISSNSQYLTVVLPSIYLNITNPLSTVSVTLTGVDVTNGTGNIIIIGGSANLINSNIYLQY